MQIQEKGTKYVFNAFSLSYFREKLETHFNIFFNDPIYYLSFLLGSSSFLKHTHPFGNVLLK